jgi:hypothetical protein
MLQTKQDNQHNKGNSERGTLSDSKVTTSGRLLWHCSHTGVHLHTEVVRQWWFSIQKKENEMQ